MEIKVYGKEGCMKCEYIKKELEGKGIMFSYIENIEKVIEKSREFGVRELPIILERGKIIGFTEMKNKIQNGGLYV